MKSDSVLGLIGPHHNGSRHKKFIQEILDYFRVSRSSWCWCWGSNWRV